MQDQLVAKQMRRWEIDQRVKARFEQDEVSKGPQLTIITVSRQRGSGGTDIAKFVARELEFKLYDREIIDQVAERSGASADQIGAHDEVRQGVFSSLVLQLLEGRRPTEGMYLRALVGVMREVANEGNAVILGRGANLILGHSYRVRIVAPEPIRIARIAELRDLDEAMARREVLETDRQRHKFCRAYFGTDQGDPSNYDLVINTEQCSIKHAAALIIKGFCDRREGLEGACDPST